MDNYRQKIKQKTAEIINGKLDPKSLNPEELFTIQHVLLKMGKIDLVKQFGEIAKQRLLLQGFKNYGVFGWNQESWEEMGIIQKYGYWMINDLPKFNNYMIIKKDKQIEIVLEREGEQTTQLHA